MKIVFRWINGDLTAGGAIGHLGLLAGTIVFFVLPYFCCFYQVVNAWFGIKTGSATSRSI